MNVETSPTQMNSRKPIALCPWYQLHYLRNPEDYCESRLVTRAFNSNSWYSPNPNGFEQRLQAIQFICSAFPSLSWYVFRGVLFHHLNYKRKMPINILRFFL